ncbi:DUF6049 family protein [Actinocorallia sp. B10E7]|uniref:DUF6049 family protein n=1 Tax=Actinocorallia sp. B10E7 TaxID=3153558 RepID=UPI00325C4B53
MKARFTAALGALFLLFAVTAFFPAATASAAGTPTAVQKQRQGIVTIVLESIKPTILTPKTKKLSVQAKITNRGTRALTGVQVQLLYGDRFGTRSQLNEFSQSQTEESTPQTLASAEPFDLAPGASAPVELKSNAVNAFARYPGQLSVYPLAVTASSPATGRLGGVHTYINYVAKDAKKSIRPTKVSFVWPLIDGPHRTTDDKFYDDGLASLIDESGRLSRLLSALDTGDGSVTLAIDPGLLTDVKAMQENYRIRSWKKDDPGEEKPRNADASAWLSKLKTHVKNPKSAFFLTPYGDVDSVALVNNRLAGGQSSLLKAAYADKKLGLDLLEKNETYPLAWTNGGTIDQKTIDRLVANKQLGSKVFLLSSNQLMANSTPYTPSAATTVQTSKGRHTTAIAFDDTIQQIISGDTRAPGAALGAQQRYLAETAMITAEAPSLSRTLVVSPDRRWNPDLAFAESLLNHKDARSNWLRPTSLREIAKPANRTSDRTYVTYTDGDRELSRHYLETVKAMNTQAYAFSKIFPQPDTSLQRAAMRVASNYWRGTEKRRTAAYRYQDAASDDHEIEVNKVSLVKGEKERQLAGSSGVLRLTIANDFTQDRGPVDVLIEISTYPVRQLVFPDEEDKGQDVYRLERTIEAGQKDTIQVPVKLPTGSSFQNKIEVEVRIYNKQYEKINTQSVFVRTTGISSIGLFITVGALAVLAVGVGFRGMRARRRRKEEEAQHDGAAV